MKAIRLIARREWLATICSPSGLIVVGLYLIMSGYIFWLYISTYQEASLREAFAMFGILTVFAVPFITMRLLSQEFRSGTFEVLTSHPVTDMQIILGKYLAGYLAFLALSVPTLAYLLILQVWGSPDWGPALSAYFGQQLLALMLLAMGLLASALTSDLLLAGMLALIGGITLWLAGTASASMQGWIGQALSYLAMFDHFSIFRRGVIDTRALAYFLTTGAMFLYLAVRAIESRRWKFGVLPTGMSGQWMLPRLSILLLLGAAVVLAEAFVSYRMHEYWSSYNTLMIAIGLALGAGPIYLNRARLRYELSRRKLGIVVTVAVNCLLVVAIWGLATYFTSKHYARADLTSSKHYALSEHTNKVLDHLDQPVEIIVATSTSSDLHQEISDLVAEYKAHSAHVTARDIDSIRNPAEIDDVKERFKLTTAPSNEVLVAIGQQVRRLPIQSLFHQRVYIINGRPRAEYPQFVGEAEITGAIIQLTKKAPGRIAFLSGHAERNPADSGQEGASTVANELKKGGWIVDNHVVTPGSTAAFAPDTSVVVVAGPQKKLSDEDLKAIAQVLDRGGGVFLLVDPGTSAGLDTLLSAWNIRLANDIVIDLRDHQSNTDPRSLYVLNFAQDHPIGKGMGSLAAVLPTARRVAAPPNQHNPNVFSRHFMLTSGDGWALPYTPGQPLKLDRKVDRRGPISVGMACERAQEFPEPGHAPLQGRLVVIGDSDFVTNRYVDMAGNMTLFLNCIDWLAGRQELISVRPKVTDVRAMTLTAVQSKLIFWLSVFAVPAAAMLAGIVTIARRSYQA